MPALARVRLIGVLLIGLALLSAATCSLAHPVPYSYVDLRVAPGAMTGTVVVHIYDAAHDLKIERPATLLTPDVADSLTESFVTVIGSRLQILADGRALQLKWGRLQPVPDRESVRIQISAKLPLKPGELRIAGPLLTYEPEHQTYLNVFDGGAVTQSILDRTHRQFEYFVGSTQGAIAVVKKFLPAGIHHILIGPDHLLFLIGLLLLGGTFRQLLGIVTAFTLAHSITLSLAALAVVSPPARIVEPVIALSIVYVGLDNLMVRGGRDLRALIAYIFGFVHGFGFASVLREMDLPHAALGWSLFAFNAGVEVGQMIVVVPVATAVGLIRARSGTAARKLTLVGSCIVIAAGAFWFVQRVFFVPH